MAEIIPLYDVAELLRTPDVPVVVVSSVAAVAAALPHLPPGWMATSWEGAPKNIRRVDWAPLKARPVVVCLANTLDREKHAHAIGKAIQGAFIAHWPETFPEDWDFTHPLPPEVTSAHIEELLKAATIPPRAADPEPQHLNGHTIAAPIIPKFRCLGYTPDDKFYFISARTQNIHSCSSKDLRSGNGLRNLEPDHLFWAHNYGNDLKWKDIGDTIIAAAYRVGVYNEHRIRARGVWLDQDRIIAHLGDTILVDGTTEPTMGIDSRFVYPVDDPLLPPDVPVNIKPLDDEHGAQLLNICRKFAWANKASGDLLAGVIATSCICGALQFRTHAWITGPAGSGKSYLMESVVARALDGIALHILGNSTEAGIRRHLSRDARPAIYDEAEGEGQAGRQRRDMIIGLMRASSTETKARILLGSGGARGESFPVRAQFILGSVGTALERETDQTRCLLLTLRSRVATTPTDRADFAAHFADIQADVATLPAHLSAALFMRMMPLAHIVRANAARFSRLIAKYFATTRIGDQVGTVLAGTYALRHTNEVSDEEALKYLARFPWGEYTTAADPQAQDEGSLLNHLGAHHVRVEAPTGTVTRTVGELCAILAAPPPQNPDDFDGVYPVTRELARQSAARIGILYAKADKDAPNTPAPPLMFWLSNTHPELKKVFASSQFPQGYIPILYRIAGAKRSPYARAFAGVSSKAILLPVEKLVHISI